MDKVFRSSWQSWTSAGAGVLVFCVVAGHALTEHSGQVLQLSFELLPAAAFCLAGYRFFVAGVYCEAEEIEIVNLLGRTRIPWSDIEGFSVGRYGRTPEMAYVHLRDGLTLPLHGIRGGGGLFGIDARSARRLVIELNDLRARRSA